MPRQPTVQEQIAVYLERDWSVPPDLVRQLLRELAPACTRAEDAAAVGGAGPDQVWLTTKQAARYLGTTGEALRKHIARGNLKPDAWGARGRLHAHRFSKAALDAFIADGRVRG